MEDEGGLRKLRLPKLKNAMWVEQGQVATGESEASDDSATQNRNGRGATQAMSETTKEATKQLQKLVGATKKRPNGKNGRMLGTEGEGKAPGEWRITADGMIREGKRSKRKMNGGRE